MQLHPLRGYPVLVFEYAKLGVSTVKMHESHEKQRQHRTPARIVCLRDSGLECRLIAEHEGLAHLPQRMPDAVGELGGAFGVFDVLLDELTPIGAERRVDEFDGGNAIEIDLPLRLAHRIECLHDVLLTTDHVERRQLAQPCRRCLGMLQRVANILHLRC